MGNIEISSLQKGLVGHWPLSLKSQSTVKEIPIVSGELHIATKDGEAMFFHDSIDFGDYSGTDSGTTKYRLEFLDAAGKKAWAYAGARGGGEVLGSELLIGNGFDDLSKWFPTGANFGWSISGNQLVHDGTSVEGLLLQGATIFLTPGHLLKLTYELTGVVGSILLGFYSSGGLLYKFLTDISLGQKSVNLNTGGYTGLAVRNLALGTTLSIDNMFLKKYVDIPTSGLHLLSTKNGSTRNMETVEANFNPNTVTKVTVYGGLIDKSNNSNNGFNINGATFTTDHRGNANGAMAFNGTNQYIDLSGDISDYASMTVGTICGWFRVADTNARGIVDISDGTTGPNRLLIFQNGEKSLRVIISSVIFTVVNAYNTNEWTFFCLSQSGPTNPSNTRLKFWINDTLTTSANSIWASSLNGLNTFKLGTLSGIGAWLNDSLADIRIYNRVLSESEIQKLYNSGDQKLNISSSSTNKIIVVP